MAEVSTFPASEVHEAMQRARSLKPGPGATLDVLVDAHGAGSALVIQDVFGVALLKSSSGDGGWRFYNEIDGVAYDFTSERHDEVIETQAVAATRDEAFAACDFQQYRALSQRFADEWEEVEDEDGRWQSCSSD